MNQERSLLESKHRDEIQQLGLEACRIKNLTSNLSLKTMIRESHSETVSTLVFNHVEPNAEAIFATVGDMQCTVYDDMFQGNYVSIVARYENQPTPHNPGGSLRAAAFVSSSHLTPHPYGDVWLAISGTDCIVSLLSVTESRITRQLKGIGMSEVVELAGSPRVSGLVAAVDKSGNVFVWRIPAWKQEDDDEDDDTAAAPPLRAPRNDASSSSSSSSSNATAIQFDHSGRWLLVGGKRGELWAHDTTSSSPLALHERDAVRISLPDAVSHSTSSIDCIRCFPDGRLVTKSTDGKLCVWKRDDAAPDGTLALQAVSHFRVPGSGSTATARHVMGVTMDGHFAAVANDDGAVVVHELGGGKCIATIPIGRIQGRVTAVALSEDCRHVLVAMGGGYVLRFEVPAGNKDEVVEEMEEGDKEGDDDPDM